MDPLTNDVLDTVMDGLDQYQYLADQTAIYPDSAKITYPLIGLVGEVGEFSNKYKKTIRDNKEMVFDDIVGELGDILWYLSALARDHNISLGFIANENLRKLASRQERGVLGGSGDNR